MWDMLETSEANNWVKKYINHWTYLKTSEVKTTLETSEDENYTQNEWSTLKRVEMSITLGTSENEYYTQNELR